MIDMVMRQKSKASHSETSGVLVESMSQLILLKKPMPSEKTQMWCDIIRLEKLRRCLLFSLQSTRKGI